MKSKRWISLALAVLMCLGSLAILGSCGPKQKAEKTVVSGVYKAMDLPGLPEDISYINRLSAGGGRVYFLGESYDKETYEYSSAIYSMKADGSDFKKLDFPWKRAEGGNINAFIPDADGSLWLYYNEYYEEKDETPETDENGNVIETTGPVETDSPAVPMPLPREEATPAVTASVSYDYTPVEPHTGSGEAVSAEAVTSPETEVPSDGGYVEEKVAVIADSRVIIAETTMVGGFYEPYVPGNYVENHFLMHVAADGTELLRIDLRTLMEEKELSYISINDLVVDGGRVYFSNQNAIVGYDATGTLLFFSELETDWIDNLFLDGKTGELVASFYKAPDYSKLNLYPIDKMTGVASETAYTLSDFAAQYAYSILTGPGYSFYFTTQNAIYGYDAAEGKEVELLNYVNSDMERIGNGNIAILSAEQFLSVDYEYEEEKTITTLQLWDFVPPEEVVPKYILTLAHTGYLTPNEQKALIAFNKTSEEYRIQLKDYSVYNNEENNWTGAVDTLNAEILAGQIPDILLIGDNMPFESYASKGLFVDLYTLMEDDEAVKKEDYLPNVFKALEINGALYELVPTIQVVSAEAKTEHLGGLSGWNMDEFFATIEKLPEGMQVFGDDINRSEVLQALVTYMYEELVDKETGECHFDTDYFKKLLTFVSSINEKSIWERDEVPEDYWMQHENRFKSDKQLLNMDSVYPFQSYWSNKEYTFGNADTTFIGFPSESRNGAAFMGELRLAISSQSPHAEGAWSFLRTFLLDEYQDDQDYQWPIKLSSLDKMAEKVLNPEPQEGDGEFDNYIIVGGYYYNKDMGMITKEAVDQVMAVVKSADRVARIDTALMDIIETEAAAFFSGSKPVEAVTPIIQSKAMMYIGEQR